MRIDKNTTIRLGDRNIVKIKIGDSVIWEKKTEPVDETNYLYIENTYSGENTITFTTKKEYRPSSNKYSYKVEYSTDKRNWSIITFDTTTPQTVTISEGEKLYLRNDSGFFNCRDGNDKYMTTINTSQKCKVGGNINTLLNYNEEIVDISGKNGCFTELFRNATNITDVSNLVMPATTLADYCYYSMFSSCKSLVNAPSLPATTLAGECYRYMFSSCSSLTTAPSLPATTLAYSCYLSMFGNCTSLTTAPALPATTLGSYCYQNMFRECSNLINPPELPATELKRNCYEYMFDSCKSLVTAPALPATKLEESCYSNMFSYCSSLVSVPELPATELKRNCYYSMFSSCKSLVNAPSLPATTLATGCYQYMFFGCSKLNSITVYAEDISAIACTSDWLNNVASRGTFNNMGNATYTKDSVSGIPTGWTEVKPVVEPDYFYIESLGDGNTISVINKGNGDTSGVTPTLEYSTDKITWNTITFDWTSGTHTTELPIALNTGDKMYFRNDTRLFSNSYDKYITFSPSISSNVGGDIRTLSNYLDVDNGEINSYMFIYLFKDNKYIVNASNLKLPYTRLEQSCYGYMFENCTSLTTAPELPSTNLSFGYSCYKSMFLNCTSLTSAPALPATTLADSCYNYMFQGCTSLTTAPALPATTLADSCYNYMFQGCTSLTTAPALPATTLKKTCYSNMFSGCTGLTTAPTLPATTLAYYCYSNMFRNCSKLNSITVYAEDISETGCTNRWLSGVASTGTFHNLGSATYATDSVSGIPTGWVEVKS